ncbi:MAG: oligosaccharide flippase family protein [Lachnospiraceae bacterium]|nr:oligosaccharide flippase family protein [Lachnospiraceae bacterium]
MKLNNTLTIRTILYSISKILSQGINAIAAIVFVRLLTTEEYGYVSIYTAWVSIVSVFISLRTDGTIQMARTKYGMDNIDGYCSSALTISNIFFSFIFFVVLGFKMLTGDLLDKPMWYIVVLLLHSYGSACLKFRSAYFAITKEAGKDLIVSLLISVLSLGLGILLVFAMPTNKYIGRIVGFALANIVLGAGYMFIMLKKGKVFFDKAYYQFCMPLALPLIFSGISTVIISQSDRIMLESMVNVEAAAIYSFAYNVALPISVIWYALNHAWVPEYHEIMAANNQSELKRHSNNYMIVFTCLSCGYILISNEMLYLMGTEDYYIAKTILPLMTAYYFLQFLYTFPINYEFYKNNTKLLGIAMTLAAVINLGLNYILIPRYSMVGALIASLVASIFMFIFHDINARFVLKDYHYSVGFYFKGIIPMVLTIALAYVFMDVMLVRWTLALIVGVILLLHVKKEKAII